MAYDGIVISSVISEIKESCEGGRVLKVQQPSQDIITLTIKGYKGQTKLYLSASAGLPIVYIASSLPQAPMQAPAFCMLLRKHLGNGKLIDIKQPGFDRVFDFIFEHMNEMGDLCERHLFVEIMGRQSNIILVDENGIILDSIKRIMPDLSTMADDGDKGIRIIYPGSKYEPPFAQGKINPIEEFDRVIFDTQVASKEGPVPKVIYSSLSGFSKSISQDIVYRAGIDARKGFTDLTSVEKDKLFELFDNLIQDIRNKNYHPSVVYESGNPKDYHAFMLTDGKAESDSISEILENFYSRKEKSIDIKSKSQDIKKVLTVAIERASKKYDIQLNQLKSTEDREIYKVYGELLNAYGYELKGGEKSLTCLNYYDGKDITIPLDPDLTAQQNSQKYFAKYNKKKRTFAAMTEFVEKTKEELDYLLSAKHSLDMAESESDIAQLRRELEMAEVLKKRSNVKGERKTAAGKPLHFISSDGYDIYVGKNNIQNEELTFELASGRDIWFHAKQAPGSHVIVKLKADDTKLESVPDRVFEEASSLAAYYSSASDADKVEVDYTERRNLKKPPKARPGYVIYHTNYSMMARPGIGNLKQTEE
jgi:predicted ribosome quality control (RQC) complex YloA/Tae2 family protein